MSLSLAKILNELYDQFYTQKNASIPTVHNICKAVRLMMENNVGEEELYCQCAKTSAVLNEALHHFRYKSKLALGIYDLHDYGSPDNYDEWSENHVWVELSGHIIDLTETQFRQTSSSGKNGRRITYHKFGRKFFAKKRFKFIGDLVDYMNRSGWPDDQTPDYEETVSIAEEAINYLIGY
jgi:hypothetical protein